MRHGHGIDVRHGFARKELPSLHRSPFIVPVPRIKVFEKRCLVTAAMIGIIYYFSQISNVEPFKTWWKNISSIKKPASQNFKTSCKYLWSLMKVLSNNFLPHILKRKNQTFQSVLLPLADFYHCCFVVRQSLPDDCIIFQSHEKIPDNIPVIELHRQKIPLSKFAHVGFLKSPKEYAKAKGFMCFKCKKYYRTASGYQPVCYATKTCKLCRLWLAKKDTLIDKKTIKMYCTSDIYNDGSFYCNKCQTTFKNSLCFKAHKKTICRYGVRCQKCLSFLRYNQTLNTAAKRLSVHQNCHSKFYCSLCKTETNFNSHICPLICNTNQSLFPKLGFLSYLSINPTYFSCFKCFKTNNLCPVHKKLKKDIHSFQKPFFAIAYIEENKRGFFKKYEWSCNESKLPTNSFSFKEKFNSFQNKYLPSNVSSEKYNLTDKVPPRYFGKTPKCRINPQEIDENIHKSLFVKMLKCLLSEKKFQNLVLICHSNSFLTDIYDSLLEINIRPKPVMFRNQFVSLVGIYEKNITFLSFQKYVKGKLYDLLQSFCPNEVFTKCFPMALNSEKYFDYNGPCPDVDYFISVVDSDEEIKAKTDYVKNFEGPFIFKNEVIFYLVQKTYVFAQACLNFLKEAFEIQDLLKQFCNNNAPLIHPFYTPICTSSSFAYCLLKLHCLTLNDIFSIKNSEKGMPTYRCSRFERELSLFMQHELPDKEIVSVFTNPNSSKNFDRLIIPDIFNETDGVIIEAAGCWAHMHYLDENCKYHQKYKEKYSNEVWKSKLLLQNKKKQERLDKIEKINIKYPNTIINDIKVYYCEWLHLKKTNLKIQNFRKNFYSHMKTVKRLIPRDVCRGGSQNVFQ